MGFLNMRVHAYKVLCFTPRTLIFSTSGMIQLLCSDNTIVVKALSAEQVIGDGAWGFTITIRKKKNHGGNTASLTHTRAST